MPDYWQYLTVLLMIMIGVGVVTLLWVTQAQKISLLLTWLWMILFTIVSGIVMLVLFLTPNQRKKQPRKVIE